MDRLFLIYVFVTALTRLAEALAGLLRVWRRIYRSDAKRGAGDGRA